MDSTGSQDSGRGGGRRSGKKQKPQQFMFIDSTSQGVNAKPDKAVRSFVMKSARSKKPWSTRQKSPKTGNDPDADSPHDGQPSPSITSFTSFTHGKVGESSPTAFGHWPELTTSPSTLSAQSHNSPSSSSCPGLFYSHSYTQPYFSDHGIACNIPQCTGEICGLPHETHTTLAARNGFSLGFAYSFDCLPVRTDQKYRGLIDNFVNAWAGGLVPLDRHQHSKASTTKWVANAIQSPTGAPFIYAVLLSSALISSEASWRDIFVFKTEAISSVNAQLQDPETRVDDNNIAAVLMLLSLEEMKVANPGTQTESDWSKKNIDMHLNGLKTMVEQRGGLVALRSNQCLQTFLLMHSIAHAIASFERPYVALLDSNGQPPPYDMPTFRSRPSSTRTIRLFQSLKPDPALLEIIGNAIVFVGDLNAWLDDPESILDPLDFQKNMSLLIYRLFDWYKLGEENADFERSPVDQSICLALIIFLAASQDPQRYHLMVPLATQKLKTALGKCLFSWGKATDLLVWTLTIGALATQATGLSAFFRENCRYAYANQGVDGLTTTHEMLDRMRKVLWVGHSSSTQSLDKQAGTLWSQMGYTQEILDTTEEGPMSPDCIKTEDVVGGLTGDRFYGRRSESC